MWDFSHGTSKAIEGPPPSCHFFLGEHTGKGFLWLPFIFIISALFFLGQHFFFSTILFLGGFEKYPTKIWGANPPLLVRYIHRKFCIRHIFPFNLKLHFGISNILVHILLYPFGQLFGSLVSCEFLSECYFLSIFILRRWLRLETI
jgi:hypothetical protein